MLEQPAGSVARASSSRWTLGEAHVHEGGAIHEPSGAGAVHIHAEGTAHGFDTPHAPVAREEHDHDHAPSGERHVPTDQGPAHLHDELVPVHLHDESHPMHPHEEESLPAIDLDPDHDHDHGAHEH